MRKPLQVYLLDVASGSPAARRLFYARPHVEPEGPRREPARGVRGWAERQFRAIVTYLEKSQGLVPRICRRVWEWLHRWTHPDELLLSRLRAAGMVEIHHPSRLDAEEVKHAWQAYLRRGNGRHWPWFLINLIVSPFTILLALLPGPNMIGYWVVYRALHHGLILQGVRRARGGKVATRFHAREELDHSIPADEDGHPAGHVAALGCDPDDVLAYLGRHGVRPPPERRFDP